MEEHLARALEGHLEDRPADESYRAYGGRCVEYLKNAGYLNCYYDYVTDTDMLYITKRGRMVWVHRSNLNLREMVDYFDRGGRMGTPEYRDILKRGLESGSGPVWRRETCRRRT